MKAAVNAIVFILKCMPIRKSNFRCLLYLDNSLCLSFRQMSDSQLFILMYSLNLSIETQFKILTYRYRTK